jgi:hypothetical protein
VCGLAGKTKVKLLGRRGNPEEPYLLFILKSTGYSAATWGQGLLELEMMSNGSGH